MNVVREIQRLNEKELQRGTKDGSWHDQYKDSAWVYVGGMPYDLSEGDVICVMSQWGEIEDIHLVRDKGSGKSKGFAFVKYEDQRSTILAVDNFNGIKLLDRTIRVDHKEKYALPKELIEKEEQAEKEAAEKGLPMPDGPRWKPGHAYEGKDIIGQHDLKKGVDLFAKPGQEEGEGSEEDDFVEEEEEEVGGEEGSRSEKKRKEEKKRVKEEKKRLKKEKKKKKKKESRSEEEEDDDGVRDRRRDHGKNEERPGAKGSSDRAASSSWRDAGPLQEDEQLPPPSDQQSWRGRYDPAARQMGPPGRGGGGGRGGGRFDTGGGRGSMFGRAFNRPGGGSGRGTMTGIGGLSRKR